MLKITDNWFYSNPWWWSKPMLVYVKGDALVLIPLFLLILTTGLISFKLMAIVYLLFFTLRALGEMIYWLLQQFGDKTYRPNDFGLTRLNNNSIYILYQVMSLSWCVMGSALLIIMLLYM